MKTLEDYYTDEEIEIMLNELYDKYTCETSFGLSLQPAYEYISTMKMNKSAKQELSDRLFCKTMEGIDYVKET